MTLKEKNSEKIQLDHNYLKRFLKDRGYLFINGIANRYSFRQKNDVIFYEKSWDSSFKLNTRTISIKKGSSSPIILNRQNLTLTDTHMGRKENYICDVYDKKSFFVELENRKLRYQKGLESLLKENKI